MPQSALSALSVVWVDSTRNPLDRHAGRTSRRAPSGPSAQPSFLYRRAEIAMRDGAGRWSI
eukprot:1688661-Pleurochrysis_carterae.AAC.1